LNDRSRIQAINAAKRMSFDIRLAIRGSIYEQNG